MQNFEERLRTCVRQEGRHLSDIIFRNWVINVSNQNCIYYRLFWCWHNFFILKINKVTIIWKTCVLFAPPCFAQRGWHNSSYCRLFCTSLLFGFIYECNMLHEHNFVFLFGNMVYHLSIVFVYFLGLDKDVAWFCFLCNFYWLPINFTKYYWSLLWTFCHWSNRIVTLPESNSLKFIQ